MNSLQPRTDRTCTLCLLLVSICLGPCAVRSINGGGCQASSQTREEGHEVGAKSQPGQGGWSPSAKYMIPTRVFAATTGIIAAMVSELHCLRTSCLAMMQCLPRFRLQRFHLQWPMWGINFHGCRALEAHKGRFQPPSRHATRRHAHNVAIAYGSVFMPVQSVCMLC